MAAVTPQPTSSERLSGGAQAGLHGLRKVFAGFREFISRGNAVELAVGVVIGAAFGAVISALQDALISPLIGWIFGQPNLKDVWNIGPYSWRESTQADPIEPIKVGEILNTLIQFLITAAAIYFLIVLPLNALANRRKRTEEPAADAIAEEVVLLREIRDLLAVGTRPAPTTASDDDARPPGTLPPSYPPAG